SCATSWIRRGSTTWTLAACPRDSRIGGLSRAASRRARPDTGFVRRQIDRLWVVQREGESGDVRSHDRPNFGRRERVPRPVLSELAEALGVGAPRDLAHPVLLGALVFHPAAGELECPCERLVRDASGGLGHGLARGLSRAPRHRPAASVPRDAK